MDSNTSDPGTNSAPGDTQELQDRIVAYLDAHPTVGTTALARSLTGLGSRSRAGGSPGSGAPITPGRPVSTRTTSPPPTWPGMKCFTPSSTQLSGRRSRTARTPSRCMGRPPSPARSRCPGSTRISGRTGGRHPPPAPDGGRNGPPLGRRGREGVLGPAGRGTRGLLGGVGCPSVGGVAGGGMSASGRARKVLAMSADKNRRLDNGLMEWFHDLVESEAGRRPRSWRTLLPPGPPWRRPPRRRRRRSGDAEAVKAVSDPEQPEDPESLERGLQHHPGGRFTSGPRCGYTASWRYRGEESEQYEITTSKGTGAVHEHRQPGDLGGGQSWFLRRPRIGSSTGCPRSSGRRSRT